MGESGNFYDIPEVVIYVSISFKFTGYLATVMVLLQTKFYGDRPITFWDIGFLIFFTKKVGGGGGSGG